MTDPTPACEVRVPTYRRPGLLRRALESLRLQTLPDWTAVVFDDSPDREGEPVVGGIGDRRIRYRPNPSNLGAAANLDRCFAAGPVAGGRYACVLEDDNALLPEFLERNAAEAEAGGLRLLFRNQLVESPAASGTVPSGAVTPAPAGRTTLGGIYRGGDYDPVELLPAAFFTAGGFSNGAAFWRTDGRSRLRIGPEVPDTGLQESLRLLRVADRCGVRLEPLAVWRDNGAESVNYRAGRWRARRERTRRLLGVAQIRREAYLRLVRAGRRDLLDGGRFAASAGRIERGLLKAGVAVAGASVPRRERLLARLHGALVLRLPAPLPTAQLRVGRPAAARNASAPPAGRNR